MKIQSLSVVVPSGGRCINDCKFCVAKMKPDDYKNNFNHNLPFYDLYQRDYIKRLEFARDNGCNTVMLTGDCEPQQNRAFLERFGTMNENLRSPFKWIEMQTTGATIDEPYLRFLRNHVGISTISVSISSFNSVKNAEICGMRYPVDINWLCNSIKKYDFNLRLSVNLTNEFKQYTVAQFFDICRHLGANQVTLRFLYEEGGKSPQSIWVRENGLRWNSDVDNGKINCVLDFERYIKDNAVQLERLEYGAMKYSLNRMSVVLDDDCMAKKAGTDDYKYLILRPNCKLYSKWDDPASLIF